MKKIILLLLLSITSLFLNAQTKKCGSWRWDVKTLTDNSGIKWFTLAPHKTTIEQLIATLPPKTLSTANKTDAKLPRLASEKKLVKITVYVTEIKNEKDRDLHFVLESPDTESEMVGEIPNPDCKTFENLPELKEKFTEVREVGDSVKQLLNIRDEAILVEIVGVPFFDATHGQTGGAPNGREIHPIISIKILDQDLGDLTKHTQGLVKK
jgi:hypothetical protein